MDDSPPEPTTARRSRFLPLRLRLGAENGGLPHERVLLRPFRLGFGEDCDIRLPGGRGPDVVFEVERAHGPLLIAKALPPEECAHYIDLKVDGEPLRQPVQELRPGARLDILDKTSQRRYQLVLDPSAVHRWLRPRNLAIAIVILVLVGGGFGAYLYRSLLGTQSDVARTTERIAQTEVELARTSRELLESVGRMGSSDAELARAIRELGQLQESSSRDIRNEFTQRITRIDMQSREAAGRIAREDTEQRRKLAAQAKLQLDELRSEFSARMVESYQQLKALEQTLLNAMAERFAARELAQPDLKQVLAQSRDAVLFIRTRYRMRFEPSGETRELLGLGTGFLVGPEGLAVSAQHVLFPWRYDRDLLVLNKLELATLVPGSVRWSVWTSGAKVLADPAVEHSFDGTQAFHSGDSERAVRILAAPQPELTTIMVPSPLGVLELPVPLPGSNDVAVFQMMRVDTPFPHLGLSAQSTQVEELDEVLVLGYPYSRLDNGRARPQAVRGFVRRVTERLLEIDAAVHPGLSGGPLLDARGHVLGMVSAIIGSEVYGAAVRVEDLRSVLGTARQHVRSEEQRLMALGCDPGPVDGIFDHLTWKAYDCEAKRAR